MDSPDVGGQYQFDPATYLEVVRAEVPAYDALQESVAAASGRGAGRILELGTGTGETASRILARHPDATLVGVDVSAEMLDAARSRLPESQLLVGRLQDPLPTGPFDLVISALAVHHLTGDEKADLFARVAAELSPGGRFVLGDLVKPTDPADEVTPIDGEFDKPSTAADQLAWLRDAGLVAETAWSEKDLAVLVATAPG